MWDLDSPHFRHHPQNGRFMAYGTEEEQRLAWSFVHFVQPKSKRCGKVHYDFHGKKTFFLKKIYI